MTLGTLVRAQKIQNNEVDKVFILGNDLKELEAIGPEADRGTLMKKKKLLYNNVKSFKAVIFGKEYLDCFLIL